MYATHSPPCTIPLQGNTHIQTNNQWLSLTDQLNLGVRVVEVDTHWVEGYLRIAHCGGAHIAMFNRLIDAVNVVAKLLGQPIRCVCGGVGIVCCVCRIWRRLVGVTLDAARGAPCICCYMHDMQHREAVSSGKLSHRTHNAKHTRP